jgi:hypothetical protein
MDLISTDIQNFEEKYEDKARKLRPFYFIVVVWGERYTDFLLNFCVASLLSPNNIPALLNKGNKFLIATTDEDWERMQNRVIFKLLNTFVEPVLLCIPPCPEELSPCTHMGLGHKLATQMAYEHRAYGAILTPDVMLSDGTVAAMQRHAVNGVEVVLTAALRFGEEPLFDHLKQIGVISDDRRSGDVGSPLVASSRQLVWASLRSFHSESLRYEWEKPYFHEFPSGIWWRVDQNGIVVHSLSWAPMLIDYNAMREHDSSVMDNWTIDGDYIFRNFGVSDKIHVVQDSDEMMHVSWAPLADREQSLRPTSHHYLNRFYGDWAKGIRLHSAVTNPIFDPLKRKILPLAVFWHADPIDPQRWNEVESEARKVLAKYCGVKYESIGQVHISVINGGLGVLIRYSYSTLLLASLAMVSLSSVIFKIGGYARECWNRRSYLVSVLKCAIRGDPDARMRFKRSLRYFGYLVLGKRWTPD